MMPLCRVSLLNNIRSALQFTRTKTTIKNRIKMNRDKKLGPKIDSMTTSLAAKGYLRSIKPYTATGDEGAIIDELSEQAEVDEFGRLSELSKFQLLAECGQTIGHFVPNSLLYTIKTIEDVKRFYGESVEKVVGLDKLQMKDLPKNLHIQYDYHRFHPETDTKFNGVTAFPGSSTLVTGLKSRKKYKGYKADELPVEY